MNWSYFEIYALFNVIIAYILLYLGFTSHAFFCQGILVVLCLMGILERIKT